MKKHISKKDWFVDNASFVSGSRLIKTHHYAGGHSKIFIALHGLYMETDRYRSLPYGVAWWLPHPSPVAASFYSDDWRNVAVLSRLVLTPDAPRNAASFLISRSIKLLPERWHTLVTYADEWQNHAGAIYRATNWQYVGMTEAKVVYTRNGIVASIRNGDKTMSKKDMLEDCVLEGYYRKHRYVYRRRGITQNLRQQKLIV